MQRGVLTDAERPLLRAAVEAELADGDQAHERLADYEGRIAWETNCGEHARLLDACRAADERAETAERERDLAVAHDRQPYPTAWAYEQVCAARTAHQERADAAEAVLDRVRDALVQSRRWDDDGAATRRGIEAALADDRSAETRPGGDGPYQVWPLARVLAEVAVGSCDWTWDEEFADLDRRHAETGYLETLEQQIRENGISDPVLIGSDGRLWDGHHRLRIASRLGIGYVPVEIVIPAAEATSGTELTADEARDVLAFVREMCDIADRSDTPMSTARVREWLMGPRPGQRVGFRPPVAVARQQLAEACPGRETEPNPCTCGCEGCKYNCAAHRERPASDQAITLNRVELAGLLAHHADVIAARWYTVAPGSGAWEIAAALALRSHANELSADEETSAVAELLDSILTGPAEPTANAPGPDQQPTDSASRLTMADAHAHAARMVRQANERAEAAEARDRETKADLDRERTAHEEHRLALADALGEAPRRDWEYLIRSAGASRSEAAQRATALAEARQVDGARRKAFAAALGADQLRDWDDLLNAARGIGRALRLAEQRAQFAESASTTDGRRADQQAERAEKAEAALVRVRDALTQCHVWGEDGDGYYRALRTALGYDPSAETPRCRYCGANCSDGRSWDGGNLYTCTECANKRATEPMVTLTLPARLLRTALGEQP